MSSFLSLLFLCFLLPACLSAPLRAEDAPVFQVSTEGGLRVHWRGNLLIASDRLHLLGPGSLDKPEGAQRDRVGGFDVVNQWTNRRGDEPAVAWRREMASRPGVINATMQFRVPPWFPLQEGGHCLYQLVIPIDAVEGMQYQAAAIRSSGALIRGTISRTMADGIVGDIGAVRYLALEGGGRKLFFDFCPAGPAVFSRGVPTTLPEGCWVEKKGDKLLCSFGSSGENMEPHFGTWVSKWRVTEDDAEIYTRRHSEENVHYFGTIATAFQWFFGPGEPPRRAETPEYQEMAGGSWASLTKPFDAWTSGERHQRHITSDITGTGWEALEKIRFAGDVSRGVLHGRVEGEGENGFSFEVPEPGMYLLTLRVKAGETAIGPGTISCNGEPVVRDLSVAPGELKIINFARWFAGKQGELRFSGAWAMSTFAAQPLLYASEDFVFQRGFWLVEGVPTPVSLYSRVDGPLPVLGAVQSIPAASPAAPWSEALVEKLRSATPLPENPATRWRFAGAITGLGPNNAGAFHEFETEEAIGRRLDEVKAGGGRALLLNGLLFRLGWNEEHARVKATIARIVELAHRRDMKVIDHFDLTVVPYHGSGYRTLLENLDFALRDVRNGQVARGYCLNNPRFRQWFFDFLHQWVKETGIDGLMLDEVAFHTRGYCGCEFCRAKFHEDTGQVLPVDETSPELLNQESGLWKLWLAWRNQCVGDWFAAMRETMQAQRPDFVLMYYSAPIGWSSSIFTRRPGGTITDAARGCDFLGTESITRNVYASWRSNIAHRALFESLRKAYGTPLFNLIYPVGDAAIAYAGWAMNQMYGQSTWTMAGNRSVEADARRYVHWTGGFDNEHAKPVADVALLFSEASRDYGSRHADFQQQILGMSEQLGDWHLPYEALLEQRLEARDLSAYRLLVLPANRAMSDRTLKMIKEYLENGGNVLAIGPAGSEGVLGLVRKRWEPGEWLGVGLARRELSGLQILEGELAEPKEDRFTGAMPVFYKRNEMPETTRVLAMADQGRSMAVVEGVVGKGRLLLVAPDLAGIGMEPEWNVGHRYKREEHGSTLLKRLVLRLLDGERRFAPVSIPEKVSVTHFEQPTTNGARATYLHFYNATGVVLTPGQKIPAASPREPFPPVKEEIVFDIELPFDGGAVGELRSPDWAGSRPLVITPLEGRRVRVTLPGGALHAYAVAVLQPKGME